MVVATEIGSLADVIFAIEGTAINGAYLNDIKTNYIIPTLEYFSQGSLEDREYVCDEVFHPSSSALYGIVVYHAADRLPSPCTDIYGPYSNPQRFLHMLDKLELVGGRGESHANVAEALATSLVCFDDMQLRREPGVSPQKHCILICNSPPYLMPVQENQLYAGNTAEQLASLFNERSVHLTILSPRKIPAMFKLYEKAGGDLSSIQTKNYAKDPRHLVLLKGFSLKERPVSPTANHMNSPAPCAPATNPVAPPVSRYPVYQSVPPRPQPPPRWTPPRSTYPTPPSGSALIEQLTRPPSIPQFNSANTIGLQQVAPNQQVTPSPRMVMTQGGPGGQGIMTGPGGPGPNMISSATSGQVMMPGAGQPGQPMMSGQPGAPMMAPSPNAGQGIMSATTGPGQPIMLSVGGATPQQGMMVIGPSGPMPTQMVPPQQQPQPSPQQPNPNIMQSQQVQPGLLGPQNPILNTGQPQQSVMIGQQPTQPIVQPATQSRGERQTIWQGVLEWIEKAKNPNEPQKLTRHVPCQVSSSTKDGDAEIKADSWPQKLIMQLMPKQLIGNIGGAYLKNSKSVLFHPTACESLDALTKVMSSGFAGCVHFSGHQTCDIKVLILLYTAEKRAYLGFIPNDQGAFVDRLRKVIQQQKSSQAIMRQQGGAQPGGQPGPGMVPQGQQQMQGLLQQPPISQAQQQQQNIGGLGGGGGGGLMGAGGGGMPAGASGLPQGPGALQPGLQQGPAGMSPSLQQQAEANQQGNNSQSQSAAFNEAARQENLVKIQRLRQTLEAAQQQELQYKQLELGPLNSYIGQEKLMSSGSLHYDGSAGIPVDQASFYTTPTSQEQQQRQEWNQPWSNKNTSNVNLIQFMNQMKMQQLQDQSQLNQQQQNQLEEQKLRAQLQQMQGGQPQQQRMMRPTMPNNPGLRHLLQQPQYRLPIQPQMRPGPGPMQPNQPQQPQQQQQFDELQW